MKDFGVRLKSGLASNDLAMLGMLDQPQNDDYKITVFFTLPVWTYKAFS